MLCPSAISRFGPQAAVVTDRSAMG